MEEYYSKHYITVDGGSKVISGWSNGSNPELDTTHAICINERGGYQFQLFGEVNPRLYTTDYLPLYKYVDGEVVPRTEGEIAEDRAVIGERLREEEEGRKERGEIPRRLFLSLAQGVAPWVASKARSLYGLWKPGVKYGFDGCEKYVQHERVTGGRGFDQTMELYRCLQPHISQAGWEPDKVPALWAVVNRENDGTPDDPILATRGMEYTYGLYYRDPENQELYICDRTGEQVSGKIILQYLPHELIGHYFKEVET